MNETYIVVPVFNEENSVVFATLEKLLVHFKHIVVVNDGGNPLLLDCLEKLPVHYLRHEINLGQGAALQTGTEYALELGAAFIAHFDADDQHDVKDLKKMILFLQEQELDVVLGSRFLTPGHAKDIPFIRKLILKGAVLVNFVFTGLLLSDAHNGLRVLNRKAALAIQIQENRQLHASEMLWLLKRYRLRFKEFPTRVVYNAYTLKKGQKNAQSLKVFMDLIINRLIK